MNTQKLMLFLGLLLTSSSITFAQQDPHFTQYFDNALFVNPAYAGSTKMLSATAIHREQWVGFEGRPSSTTFSIHSPLSYESVRDVLGPLKQTMFYGDFSYSLRFKKSRSLAFGLKAGLNLINMETATLNTTQESDPHLITNTLNKVNPNFGFGVYYRSPKLFFGLSTPKIIEQSYDGSANNREKRHYFALVGGIIKMNTSWKLRPTAQVKMTAGAPISMDLSVAAIHRDQLYLGAMYRYGAAYGIFVQYQISQQFRLGLASDFGTQALRNYNNGTFEVMLSYDFSFNKEGVRSPRYF